MGVHVTCDGCGNPVASGDAVVLGIVRKREYCNACAWDVLEFVRDRDELHTSIAEEWRHRALALSEEFHRKHPKGVLPDEAG